MDPACPFAQFLLAVEIVVAPVPVASPPLRRIASMQSHVRHRPGDLQARRKGPGKGWFIHRNEAELELSQEREHFVLVPGVMAKLDEQRQFGQPVSDAA